MGDVACVVWQTGHRLVSLFFVVVCRRAAAVVVVVVVFFVVVLVVIIAGGSEVSSSGGVVVTVLVVVIVVGEWHVDAFTTFAPPPSSCVRAFVFASTALCCAASCSPQGN